MADPTLDELIAWAEGFKDVGTVSAFLAALRELRQLREGVAKVREMPAEDEDKPNTHDEIWAQGYNAGWRATLRALTPEGTT